MGGAHFWCFSHLVCGVLLWQLEVTKTLTLSYPGQRRSKGQSSFLCGILFLSSVCVCVWRKTTAKDEKSSIRDQEVTRESLVLHLSWKWQGSDLFPVSLSSGFGSAPDLWGFSVFFIFHGHSPRSSQVLPSAAFFLHYRWQGKVQMTTSLRVWDISSYVVYLLWGKRGDGTCFPYQVTTQDSLRGKGI